MVRAAAISTKAPTGPIQPSRPEVAANPKPAMEAENPPRPIRMTFLRPSRSDSLAQTGEVRVHIRAETAKAATTRVSAIPNARPMFGSTACSAILPAEAIRLTPNRMRNAGDLGDIVSFRSGSGWPLRAARHPASTSP